MVAVERSKIFVGLGGWEFGAFDRFFYPPKIKKGFRKLEHYSRLFDHVEVNATFYNATFGPEHARRWVEDVAANDHFIFTVKLFRGFTHTLKATNDDVRSVRTLLEPIAEAGKLGGLVMQFPHSFINSPEHQRYLRQFNRVFYPHRIFVEMRHASWNNSAAFTFLQENGLHLVNVDLPPAKERMPFTAEGWGSAAYFRMMGRGKPVPGYSEFDSRSNYFYTKKELDILYSRIKNVKPATGVTFVAFHNVVDSALVNAMQLRHRLDAVKRTSAPEDVVHGADVFDRFTELMDARYPLFAQAS